MIKRTSSLDIGLMTVENHDPCRESYPARLLNLVRFWSSGDIVLVELEEDPDEHVPYTALSHCWGDPISGPLTTTLTNLGSRKERIRFDDNAPKRSD